MINSREEEMRVRYARLAGFMYLLVFALFFGGDYIVTHIRGEGSFSEITNRIIQSQNLYRLGLSMDVAEALCTVLMALGLYVVVKPVDRNLALLAFTFRMAEVISGSSQVITRFTALQLRLGADYTKSFDANQLSALVASQSDAHSAAFFVSAIFFGAGSTVFFYLFLKSGYIPKIISGFGLFSSLLVMFCCFTNLVLPEYGELLDKGWLPISLAEIVTGLWLLIKGVNPQASPGVRYGGQPA